MPTDCTPALFEFPPIEGRHVVASFDGGAITSDAGALLLGQTDRAIRLTELRGLLRRHTHRRAGGAPGRDPGDAARHRYRTWL